MKYKMTETFNIVFQSIATSKDLGWGMVYSTV